MVRSAIDAVSYSVVFGDVLIGEEDGEEVDVDGEGDDLRVNQRNVDPVVSLDDALVFPKVVQGLRETRVDGKECVYLTRGNNKNSDNNTKCHKEASTRKSTPITTKSPTTLNATTAHA